MKMNRFIAHFAGVIRKGSVATVCALAAISAIPSIVSAQPKGLPPLIDRDLFFGDPEIAGAQISPDGKFIAFIKPFKGTLASGSNAPRSV
jgi:hypothetical protein